MRGIFVKIKVIIKRFIITASFCFGVLIGMFIMFCNVVEENQKVRNVEVRTQNVEIPAVEAKDAVYAKGDEVEFFAGDETIDRNNDGKPDYNEAVVGEDIEPGEYIISSLELDSFCSLKLKGKGEDNMFDGDQYYEGDEITLTEGDHLAGFNCLSNNGGLEGTLTSTNTEIIEEAVEAEPAKQVKEEYIIDIDSGEESCKIDNKAVDCSKLSDLEKIKKSQVTSTEKIVEKIKVDFGGTTCYINHEVSECENLVNYDAIMSEM